MWYTKPNARCSQTPALQAHPGHLLPYRVQPRTGPRLAQSAAYADDRKRIGADIQTVEFGWPIGMPVCRPLGDGMYEVRTTLTHHRIARVLFYIDRNSRMVLLHGFIKKTRATPSEDLALARTHKTRHQQGEK